MGDNEKVYKRINEEKREPGLAGSGQGRTEINCGGLAPALLIRVGRLSAERNGALGTRRCCMSMRMHSSFIQPSP